MRLHHTIPRSLQFQRRLGSTPKRDAVDSDFRHYYHLAALELLLVHHGFRPCETTLSSQQDMHQLEKTISAVEAFQRNRSLPSDPLGLNGPFWEELVVPVKPGDESAAVLALRWLVQSTSQVSRPPLWDTMEVERHGCQAQLDASMQAQIQGSLAANAELMNEFNASWPVGLPSSVWRHLLQRAEQRVASGCLGRAFVARAFGVAWVFVWCLSAGFFAFFHIDGWNHGSSEKACMEPKTFRKVLRFGHEVALLGVVMLSHSLSVLGLWSFPSDLVSQVFVGFQITAAAVVAVRLAAKRGRRLPPQKKCIKYSAPILLMVLAFLFYCLVSLVPGLHGLWYAVFLAGLLAAWSIAVLVIADWNRVMKCGLFFAMWILAFVAPTLLSILVGLLGTFGFWLSAFTPVLLLLLSLAAERLIGPLIEVKCEYTAETNWMLALLFRMCIEQVRFNTALAVLLLSLLAQRGFGPFLLHLVQSFLFAVALRRPKIVCTSRDALASAPQSAFCRYLFHASQIVSHTGSGAIWQYRSEAVVLPLEIALFLTHMFQLLLVGMPVGVSAASWWLGLVLLVLFSTGCAFHLASDALPPHPLVGSSWASHRHCPRCRYGHRHVFTSAFLVVLLCPSLGCVLHRWPFKHRHGGGRGRGCRRKHHDGCDWRGAPRGSRVLFLLVVAVAWAVGMRPAAFEGTEPEQARAGAGLQAVCEPYPGRSAAEEGNAGAAPRKQKSGKAS
ncbi:unnamed protein product [Symbiodinium sp. CCMP2592]|nr:unnamed protein product [Symbiodinium sp. CCMP2592]